MSDDVNPVLSGVLYDKTDLNWQNTVIKSMKTYKWLTFHNKTQLETAAIVPHSTVTPRP